MFEVTFFGNKKRKKLRESLKFAGNKAIKQDVEQLKCNYLNKMSEIMDIRLQHHLAQEFYRQQMLQRIPGNYFHPKNFLSSLKVPKNKNICLKFTFGDGNPSTSKNKQKINF